MNIKVALAAGALFALAMSMMGPSDAADPAAAEPAHLAR